MEALIETITVDDEQPLVRITLTVRRSTYRATRPKETDYIQPWMHGSGYEQELADSQASYKAAVESWRISETLRIGNNNEIEALRLGDCTLLQDSFVPEKVPE